MTTSYLIYLTILPQTVKNLPVMQETQLQSLGWEDSLKKGIATDSSILAWIIPWTEEPGRLQYMGSQESDTTEQLTLISNIKIYFCQQLSLILKNKF